MSNGAIVRAWREQAAEKSFTSIHWGSRGAEEPIERDRRDIWCLGGRVEVARGVYVGRGVIREGQKAVGVRVAVRVERLGLIVGAPHPDLGRQVTGIGRFLMRDLAREVNQ